MNQGQRTFLTRTLLSFIAILCLITGLIFKPVFVTWLLVILLFAMGLSILSLILIIEYRQLGD